MKAIPILLLLAYPVAADEGASFLKIGVGARATGTGTAQTALSDDAAAIYWNPAGLASAAKTQVAAHHAELFADTRYDFMALSRATRFGTIGAGVGYLSQGTIEGRDENRAPIGNFTASDSVFGLALARNISRGLGIGIGLKGIQSRIAGESAATAAVDLGARWKSAQAPVTLGVAILNFGPGMRFINERSSLPLTLAVGGAFRLPLGITLAADARFRPNSDSKEYGVGTEYAALSGLMLRAGWLGSRTVEGRASKIVPQGFAAGLGLKVSSFYFDYSFQPYGELGNAQRLSLASRF